MTTSLTSPSLALPGIAHGFFTRHGGVSSGIYTSLNCAYGTGDEDANVSENIRRAAGKLGAHAVARLYQVHSSDAVIATAAWKPEDRPRADAVVTNVPGLAVGVTTADCVPILLADAEARVVAAAHAGWKGARSGIIESTLAAMEKLGAGRNRVAAAVGPCIGWASYEVGPEFLARFLEDAQENNGFFMPSKRPGHYLFDLAGYVQHRLVGAGIASINALAQDTCLLENAFFSYRRTTLAGGKAYGCQLSAIALT